MGEGSDVAESKRRGLWIVVESIDGDDGREALEILDRKPTLAELKAIVVDHMGLPDEEVPEISEHGDVVAWGAYGCNEAWASGPYDIRDPGEWAESFDGLVAAREYAKTRVVMPTRPGQPDTEGGERG